MFLVLYVVILMLFGQRKIEAVVICDKLKPFLIDVNVLYHIAVCSIVLDQVADPRNLQKLVVIGEKGLKITMLFFNSPFFTRP